MATSLLIRRATTLVTFIMSRISPLRGSGQVDSFESRLATIEAREEISSMLFDLAQIVDEALLSGLSTLTPRLHASFTMRVVDTAGTERRYVGAKGLVDGYAPIMTSGPGRLIASAISVELEGTRARASFKLAGAVKSSPELGLPTGQTVLLVSGNEARFLREGGVWKLASLVLVHAMAYPEQQTTRSAPRARRASASGQEMAPRTANKTRSRKTRAAK
jgi:hypothetical protein